jgi:hypothetical protein
MSKNFLLYSGGTYPETEEEMAELMKVWGAWYTSRGSSVVDPGNPVSSIAKISPDGRESEGSIFPQSIGYSILDSGTKDEAVKMAQNCPVLLGGSKISLLEITNVM